MKKQENFCAEEFGLTMKRKSTNTMKLIYCYYFIYLFIQSELKKKNSNGDIHVKKIRCIKVFPL